MTSKKFKYDGRSRPTTDLYKKNFERIFGKKIMNDNVVDLLEYKKMMSLE